MLGTEIVAAIQHCIFWIMGGEGWEIWTYRQRRRRGGEAANRYYARARLEVERKRLRWA